MRNKNYFLIFIIFIFLNIEFTKSIFKLNQIKNKKIIFIPSIFILGYVFYKYKKSLNKTNKNDLKKSLNQINKFISFIFSNNNSYKKHFKYIYKNEYFYLKKENILIFFNPKDFKDICFFNISSKKFIEININEKEKILKNIQKYLYFEYFNQSKQNLILNFENENNESQEIIKPVFLENNKIFLNFIKNAHQEYKDLIIYKKCLKININDKEFIIIDSNVGSNNNIGVPCRCFCKKNQDKINSFLYRIYTNFNENENQDKLKVFLNNQNINNINNYNESFKINYIENINYVDNYYEKKFSNKKPSIFTKKQINDQLNKLINFNKNFLNLKLYIDAQRRFDGETSELFLKHFENLDDFYHEDNKNYIKEKIKNDEYYSEDSYLLKIEKKEDFLKLINDKLDDFNCNYIKKIKNKLISKIYYLIALEQNKNCFYINSKDFMNLDIANDFNNNYYNCNYSFYKMQNIIKEFLNEINNFNFNLNLENLFKLIQCNMYSWQKHDGHKKFFKNIYYYNDYYYKINNFLKNSLLSLIEFKNKKKLKLNEKEEIFKKKINLILLESNHNFMLKAKKEMDKFFGQYEYPLFRIELENDLEEKIIEIKKKIEKELLKDISEKYDLNLITNHFYFLNKGYFYSLFLKETLKGSGKFKVFQIYDIKFIEFLKEALENNNNRHIQIYDIPKDEIFKFLNFIIDDCNNFEKKSTLKLIKKFINFPNLISDLLLKDDYVPKLGLNLFKLFFKNISFIMKIKPEEYEYKNYLNKFLNENKLIVFLNLDYFEKKNYYGHEIIFKNFINKYKKIFLKCFLIKINHHKKIFRKEIITEIIFDFLQNTDEINKNN